MKRLLIVLFLLGASNVQAFSFTPVKWARETIGWVKDNKKKVAGALALGAGSYFGYKARTAHPNLNMIAALRRSLAHNLAYTGVILSLVSFWGAKLLDPALSCQIEISDSLIYGDAVSLIKKIKITSPPCLLKI